MDNLAALLLLEQTRLILLHGVDFAIIAIYFAFVLFIGFYVKGSANTSNEFFMAGREMTVWIAGLSFIASNMGSLELMGWAGSAYQYGMLAAHAYWIGAIPAMLVLGVVMMPFYYISKVRSVSEYLYARFGSRARAFSAITFAFMTILMSGINMYAMAVVFKVVLGWNLHFSIWASSIVVASYVALGGLRSAIYNEVLQFILIWAGALSIPVLGMIEVGGWKQLVHRVQRNTNGSGYLHLWQTLGHSGSNPMGVSWVGVVFGWGFVLSFGYWTTDFLVIQRTLAARNLRAARLAPILGAGFKFLIPLIVTLPGMLALSLLPFHLQPDDVAAATNGYSYSEVLPLMLVRYCGPGLLGLGVTALIAGFMSGMAGNVSAFSTVWTYDIYGAFLRRDASDQHYLQMGRICTVAGVLISVGTAYLVQHATSIMEYVLQLFSFFIAPLFGTVILGMLWKRATDAGGFWGLVSGTLCSIGLWIYSRLDPAALRYIAFSPHAKEMAENMYRSMWSWSVCVIVTVAVSYMTQPKSEEQLKGLVYGVTELPSTAGELWYQKPIIWAAVIAAALVAVNIAFW